MVYKSTVNMMNQQKGITLIELVIIICIMAVFSLIMISDFPKIIREYALSKVTYKMSQDLRGVQDSTLSGMTVTDYYTCKVPAKDYGVYFNTQTDNQKKQYIIFADVNDDGMYDSGDANSNMFCEDQTYFTNSLCDMRILMANNLPKDYDCIISIVSLVEENTSLTIDRIASDKDYDLGVRYGSASISFYPPAPNTVIKANGGLVSQLYIVLKNTDGSERSVLVKNSGLINVE